MPKDMKFWRELSEASDTSSEVTFDYRGTEGLKQAAAVLEKRQSIGLLIGGVAERMMYPNVVPADLVQSKDIDILILDGDEEAILSEGAKVDWFFPTELTDSTSYFRNVKNLILFFRLHINSKSRKDLVHGLYVPSLSLLNQILEIESKVSKLQAQALGSEQKLASLKKFGVPDDTPTFQSLSEEGVIAGRLDLDHVEVETLTPNELKQARAILLG